MKYIKSFDDFTNFVATDKLFLAVVNSKRDSENFLKGIGSYFIIPGVSTELSFIDTSNAGGVASFFVKTRYFCSPYFEIEVSFKFTSNPSILKENYSVKIKKDGNLKIVNKDVVQELFSEKYSEHPIYKNFIKNGEIKSDSVDLDIKDSATAVVTVTLAGKVSKSPFEIMYLEPCVEISNLINENGGLLKSGIFGGGKVIKY